MITTPIVIVHYDYSNYLSMILSKCLLSWCLLVKMAPGMLLVKLGGIIKSYLTHWGQVTRICVGDLNIIGSDNGLSHGRCQTTVSTNAAIVQIGPLRTKCILNKIQTFSLNKCTSNFRSFLSASMCQVSENIQTSHMRLVFLCFVRITLKFSLDSGAFKIVFKARKFMYVLYNY